MTIPSKTKILIVDDDPQKISLLKMILADLPVEILEASSGTGALRMILHHDFAVILLDVNMPGMNGFETATIIRQHPRSEHTPIIFVTAISTTDINITRGYNLGAVDYMLTPIVPDILRAKIKVFTDLFELSVQLSQKSADLESAYLELKGHVNEIESLNSELELSYHELETFSYSVSHDLRAPLRHLDSYLNLLIEEAVPKENQQAQKYIERITTVISRMRSLIEDLLSLSRITRQALEKETFNLSDLVGKVFGELRKREPERQVETQVEPDIKISGDPGLLKIALENLLGNAWKFTGKNPSARIEFGRADLLGKESYFIRDNGVGFDPEKAGQLFAPFQRLHSEADFPGTGIGLATVQRIIRRHRGRIWAEAEVGKGATFYFTLS